MARKILGLRIAAITSNNNAATRTPIGQPAEIGEAMRGVRPLKDMPITKNFANTVMNILTRLFYNVNVSDSQTGFRALTVDALNKISINAQGYLISSEFIREINDKNIPFEEVIIRTIYNEETQHKGTNFKVGIKIMFLMIKHRLFD